MEQAFIDEIKGKLLEQRKDIVAALNVQNDDMKNLVKPVETGDEADVASDVIDRALLNALSAQDTQRLQLIDAALDRINQGKFGVCLQCGKEISHERLNALPWAFLCINCANKAERRNR
ncbi:MAG: TraR/DksA C4-type zinc finger protein [Treponema sp.]|nr:TraR/DksA C4-type zinc finger protein [Treponema sp.]